MSKKYDVVAAMGEYTDREGNTKVRWQNCGAVIETKNGLALKLESVPVGNQWEGWFKLFEPNGQKASSKVNQGRDTEMQSHGVPHGGSDFDDDIPF